MEKPKTIGVFNGFLSWDAKLLLQLRADESWMGRVLQKSYKGLWELNGGGFKVQDPAKELTLPFLKEKAISNAANLGVSLIIPDNPSMCLTIYENKEKGILDWAIMFPACPGFWVGLKKLSKNVMFVDVDGLNRLANRPEGKGSLVSGWGKRQHRMGLCALWHSCNIDVNLAAYKALWGIKPDFYGTEFSNDAEEFLAKLRKGIASA